MNSEFKRNSTDISKMRSSYWMHTRDKFDTKIIVHIKHCLLNSLQHIVVKTVNTDVITLLLAHLSFLDSQYKIEVDFHFGKYRRFIKINDVCPRITPDQKLALTSFFSFTCCDFTSSFFGISKSTWWNIWC